MNGRKCQKQGFYTDFVHVNSNSQALQGNKFLLPHPEHLTNPYYINKDLVSTFFSSQINTD